eukprot:10215584-Ditylum_brightwellii.AAC.1
MKRGGGNIILVPPLQMHPWHQPKPWLLCLQDVTSTSKIKLISLLLVEGQLQPDYLPIMVG